MSDTPQLVLIEWVDSSAPCQGWQRLSDLDAGGGVKRISVGFLVQEDSRSKVIAAHLGSPGEGNEWDQAAGLMTIPTASITKLKFISAFQMSTPKPRPLANAEWLRRLA